jgi:hypothetical protein
MTCTPGQGPYIPEVFLGDSRTREDAVAVNSVSYSVTAPLLYYVTHNCGGVLFTRLPDTYHENVITPEGSSENLCSSK